MVAKDRLRQLVAKCRRQARDLPIEQIRLRESPHLETPLYDLPRPSECQPPILLARDSQHPQVDLRRVRPVDLQLASTSAPSQVECREIHVVETNRLLHLVGAITGEKDNRTMGLLSLDAIDRRVVDRTLSKEGEHLGLHRIAGGD